MTIRVTPVKHVTGEFVQNDCSRYLFFLGISNIFGLCTFALSAVAAFPRGIDISYEKDLQKKEHTTYICTHGSALFRGYLGVLFRYVLTTN